MSNRFAYPAERTYTTLWNMVDPDNGLLLGLGRTNSWPIETSPPDVDLMTTQQEQLACYFPATVRKVAKRVSSGGGGVFQFGGQFFQLYDASSLDSIRSSQATHLYIEAVVDHNLMPNNSFRSVGLYRFVKYNSNIPDNLSIYLPSDVTAALYFLEHLEPIIKTTNLKQTFKIVVKG